MRKRATPDFIRPSREATIKETSSSRSPMKGPRSLIRTTWLWPVLGFVTRSREPNGSQGWAAVAANMSYTWPLAVVRPSNSPPYQLATPDQTLIGFGGLEGGAESGA